MCSQPIVQDAQLLRATSRDLLQLLGRQSRGTLERRRCEVARRQRRHRVECEQVGQRAELSVLLRGRTEAAGAKVLGGGQNRRSVGHRYPGPGLDHHGLDVLRPEHGAEAAAAGMATVVADRRVPDTAFTGGSDGRCAPPAPVRLPQRLFGLCSRHSCQLGGRYEPDAVVGYQEHRQLIGASADDDGIVARQLARDGELARRQRVGDESGQRGFGNHREFGARGEGGADQRREDERQGRLRRKRIDERRCQAVQQPRAQPDAAEVCPKDPFLELQWRA